MWPKFIAIRMIDGTILTRNFSVSCTHSVAGCNTYNIIYSYVDSYVATHFMMLIIMKHTLSSLALLDHLFFFDIWTGRKRVCMVNDPGKFCSIQILE